MQTIFLEQPRSQRLGERREMDMAEDDAQATTRLLPGDTDEAGDETRDSQDPAPSDQKRELGFTSVALLISNRIVGTGIFATPTLILRAAGSVGGALALWLVGSAIAAAGTALYIEFGTGIPRSGGEKNYLEFLYPRPKYLVTCAYAMYAVTMGWVAGNSVIFGEYVLHVLGVPVNAWNQRALGIACVSAATLLHGRSLRWGLRVQNALGAAKLALLAVVALAGLALFARAIPLAPGVEPPHNFRAPFAGTTTAPNALVTGLYGVIWSYVGYANANAALSEVKNPVENIRRAAPLAVATVASLYILVNLAYFAAASTEGILGGGTTIAALFFRNVFGPSAGRFLSACIALSAFGAVLSVLFSLSRINQELAREGVLPFSAFFASNQPYGTPFAGLALHWAATVVIILAAPPGDAFHFIVNVISYPLSLINAAISGGLLVLYLPGRAARARWDPPFRAGAPVVAFFCASNVFLVLAPLVPPPGDARPYAHLPYWLHVAVGFGVFALGAVYWAVWAVLLPRWGGYALKRRFEVGSDGMRTAVFVKIPNAM